MFGTTQNKSGTQSGDDEEKYGSKIHKLDTEYGFLLFMMWIRLGRSITDLSFRFSVSEGKISSITTRLISLFVHLMTTDFKESGLITLHSLIARS